MDKKIQKTEKCCSINCKRASIMRTKYRSVLFALFVGAMSMCAVQNAKAQFTYCDAYNYYSIGGYYVLRSIDTYFGGGHLTLPETLTCGNITAPVGECGWEFPVSARLGYVTSPYPVITGITLPFNCKRIAGACFRNGSGQDYPLRSLDAPGVTEIAEAAFEYQTLLTNVNIPVIETIKRQAFKGCTSLSSFTLPSSVTCLSYSAFWGCNNMKQITVYRETPLNLIDIPVWYADTLGGIVNCNKRLIVPRGTKSLYAAVTSNWRKFIIMENVEVSAVPQENSAIISWYKEDEATGYTLTVYTDFAQTQVFGKYELNENGQKSTRLSYTVDELLKETQYWYTLEALSGTDVIAVFENNFVTTDGTSIADISQNETIKIYPNPTTGKLKIESGENKGINPLVIEVYDITGRKIVNCQLSTFNSIDISHLSNGIYFVVLKTDKGELTTKIIKE